MVCSGDARPRHSPLRSRRIMISSSDNSLNCTISLASSSCVFMCQSFSPTSCTVPWPCSGADNQGVKTDQSPHQNIANPSARSRGSHQTLARMSQSGNAAWTGSSNHWNVGELGIGQIYLPIGPRGSRKETYLPRRARRGGDRASPRKHIFPVQLPCSPLEVILAATRSAKKKSSCACRLFFPQRCPSVIAMSSLRFYIRQKKQQQLRPKPPTSNFGRTTLASQLRRSW